MKKKIVIIVSVLLVLCVLGGVGVYFAWQSASQKITNIQNELTGNPTTAVDEINTSDETGTSAVCSMLTLDMAKEILGEQATLASQNPNNCTYSLTNIETSSFGILTIIVSKSNVITAKSNFEAAKTAAYANQIEQVTGLNVDDAYFGSTLKQLSILKGDSWIIISAISDKYSNEKEAAIATAKLVLK